MGMEGAFFSAVDDEAAVEAEHRVGGPLGWPQVTGQRKVGLLRKEPVVTELGAAYDGFAARGYDGAVNMGTLEELLTGRDYDAITEDQRWAGSPSAEEAVAPEDHGVISLTDTLRDALAEAPDTRLEEIVGPWSQTEELRMPGWQDVSEDEHLQFLRDLRDLARRAKDAGHRLYWYFAV